MRFNPHIEGVQFPPITEVKGWLAERSLADDRPLVDCCQAVPDYPPAAELVTHLRERVTTPEINLYSADEGLPEVRQAVSDWYARRYGAAPSPDELCLTIGASQAFWLAITTLCTSGDEVLLPAPAYFDHPMALQALGVRPVWIPFSEETAGLPDIAAFADRLTAKTRAILLVSPSNPTGKVIPAGMIRELFALCRRHDLALIIDETYHAFLPDGQRPHELFADPAWPDTFVHLASFGKTFALTGYRAGALAAGRHLIRQALKIQDTMAVCQPRITQAAVQYGCRHLDDWVARNNRLMQERHERFRSGFARPENPFQLLASGSFFAWVRHPWGDLDSRQAARRLVAEANLICLPGGAFGPELERYLRLAIGNLPAEKIQEVVARFQVF